jgi:hypothetical protein
MSASFHSDLKSKDHPKEENVYRRLASALAIALAMLLLVTGLVLATTITIDGNTGDWPGDPGPCTPGPTPPCAMISTDPNEGTIPDGYDLEQTWFTNDATYAYFRIDTYAPITFTRNAERIDFCLDADQDGGGGTGWTDGTCNGISADNIVRLVNIFGSPAIQLLSCDAGGCNTLLWTGTTADFALGTHAVEMRVPFVEFTPAITNGQAISMAAYFDNSDSPPDDHSPDSGANTIIVGCGAPGGNCSPTAITLNTLEAKTEAKNQTAGLILIATAMLAIGVVGAVSAARRRRYHA